MSISITIEDVAGTQMILVNRCLNYAHQVNMVVLVKVLLLTNCICGSFVKKYHNSGALLAPLLIYKSSLDHF